MESVVASGQDPDPIPVEELGEADGALGAAGQLGGPGGVDGVGGRIGEGECGDFGVLWRGGGGGTIAEEEEADEGVEDEGDDGGEDEDDEDGSHVDVDVLGGCAPRGVGDGGRSGGG